MEASKEAVPQDMQTPQLSSSSTPKEGVPQDVQTPQLSSSSTPGALKYALFFYFCSYFSQRTVTSGLATINVFLIDRGFDEDDLALVRMVGFSPFVLKIFASWFNDRWPPPWPGSKLLLSGRRRPVIWYGSFCAVLGTVLFAVFNSSDPSVAGVAGCLFLATAGAAVSDQAIDGHAVELVAQTPPEYIDQPLVQFTGRVGSASNSGFMLGFIFSTLVVTQLGPAWSWAGAFLMLAAASTLTLFLVCPLKDVIGNDRQPSKEEGVSCRLICDMVKARGTHEDTFRFTRKILGLTVLVGFSLGGIVLTIVPWAKRVYDISSQEEGYILIAGNMGFGLGSVLGGVCVDFLGTSPVLVVSTIAAIPSPLLILLAVNHGGVAYIVAAMFWAGFMMGPGVATTVAILVNNAVPEMPAFFITTAFTMFNFGFLLGGGMLIVAKRFSYDAAYVILTVCFALCSFLIILLLLRDPHARIRSGIKDADTTTQEAPMYHRRSRRQEASVDTEASVSKEVPVNEEVAPDITSV